VFGAPTGSSVAAPNIAGNATHAVVTYFDPSPEISRVVGRFLRPIDETLTWDSAVDLTHQAVEVRAGFAYRRSPMLLATEDGALFALPAHGGVQSRAGTLTLDGETRGGVRTVTGLGSIFEQPRFVTGDEGVGLLFDSTGLHGERSLLAFSDDGATLIEIVGVFGSETESRSQARLGATSGRAVTFVWDVASGPPRVAVFENDRW
jgi:hypothetical protein